MKYTLLFLLVIFFTNQHAQAASSFVYNNLQTINAQKRSGKNKRIKPAKKSLKSFFKYQRNDPESKKEKKKLPFGTIALISLVGIPIGLLIGTGLGNILIFISWFTAVIYGLRGMKKDKNKFLGLIALAVALGLLISTFTFIEGGVFG